MATVQAQTFGRYELLELLAQGGMGQVYRALLRGGPGFAKEVALKRVLKAFGSDPIFVTRFADEARIASTLSHGNIVQVFDFGEVEGEYYLAMEFIDGPNLGALITAARNAGKRLPIPFSLQVAAGLCRGLGAAHGRRDINDDPAPVVHRDISPANVLLTRAGEVKVTDFGIAKAADKVLRTQTGMVLGKCRYMSPEQAAGEKVDVRTDIFSVGCVLYEMLLGEPLFAGRTVDQILRNVLLGAIPRPSEGRAEIPAELDAILARALHRDHRERHSDGTPLARELEGLLHTLAPRYSRDDVAALISELVPARPRRASSLQRDHATPLPSDDEATRPAGEDEEDDDKTRPPLALGERPTVEARGGTELGMGDATPAPRSEVDQAQGEVNQEQGEVDEDKETARRERRRPRTESAPEEDGASPRGTPDQETALLERADGAETPLQPAELPPTLPQPAAAERGPIDGGDSRLSNTWSTKRRGGWTLIAGASAGLALGVLVGLFWPRAATPAAQQGVGESGPWRVRLLAGRLHRGGEGPARRRLSFLLRTSGPDAKSAPRYFGLRRGQGPLSSPLAWQRRGPTETLVIFPWPPGRGELRLRFSPPDAPAIDLVASLHSTAKR